MHCRSILAALSLAATPALAAEPGTPPIPPAAAALAGCWQGRGEIMGKPVTIRLAIQPIVLEAMLAVDAESSAIANPYDRYAAHILLGGGNLDPARIESYWADSFGGSFAAIGQGSVVRDTPEAGAFDVTYFYPDGNMLNRWRRVGDQLGWSIVTLGRAASVAGKEAATRAEKPFADYSLSRTACAAPAPAPATPPPAANPPHKKSRRP